MSLIPGAPVICSTKRSGGALSYGATGGPAPHLTTLTCRAPFHPPAGELIRAIFRPISERSAQDTFGISAENKYAVHADWTNPNNEPYPVAPNDTLVLPDGTEVVIEGVKLYAGMMIFLLVGMPHPSGR